MTGNYGMWPKVTLIRNTKRYNRGQKIYVKGLYKDNNYPYNLYYSIVSVDNPYSTKKEFVSVDEDNFNRRVLSTEIN